MTAMTYYDLELVLTQPMLGTVPKAQNIYEIYIQAKAVADLAALDETLPTLPPQLQAQLANRADAVAAEVETVPEGGEDLRGQTGFHTLADGTPFIFDYLIKGFFKDACGMLRRAKGTRSSKITAYKKIIDGMVFVTPRQIVLELPPDGAMSSLERPLRTSGPTGERVALAKSDTVPAGTKLRFTLCVLGDEASEDVLREWFDYGVLRGLGQWRNASWGSFTYTMTARG